MAKAGTSHDAVLETIAATPVVTGVMFARRPKEPVYRVSFIPPLSTQLQTSEASYAGANPAYEKPVAQDDWRKGAGEIRYQTGSKRYYYGVSVDARFKNRIILGPLRNAAATPTSATFGADSAKIATWTGNGDMEAGNPPTGWSAVGSAELTRITTVHGGTYALQVAPVSGSEGAKAAIYKTAELEGIQISVRAWVRHSAGADRTIRVRILDEKGAEKATQNTTVPTFATVWTQTTAVTYTLGTGDSEFLQVEITEIGAANSFLIDDVTITHDAAAAAPGIGTPGEARADYSGDYYIGTTTGLWKWLEGTTLFNHVQGSPRNITFMESFPVSGTTYLMIACGYTKGYWYWDGTTFTKFSGAAPDDKAFYLRKVGTNLYKSETATAISYTSNPLSSGTAWTAPATIGTTDYNITGLVNDQDVLFVMKENGAFKFASDVATEIAGGELRTLFNANSGKHALTFRARTYFPMGTQALYEYEQTNKVLQSVSVSKVAQGIAELGGQVKALANDEEYLFALVADTTVANLHHILAGRYEVVDDVSAWAWHGVSSVYGATFTVYHMQVSTADSPSRLWVIMTQGGQQFQYYYYLPAYYSDPTKDSNYKFTGAGIAAAPWGHFFTPYFDLNFVDPQKGWIGVTLESQSLATGFSNERVRVDYRLDNATAWTNFDGNAADGTGNTFNASPIQTLYLPSSTSIVKGRRIQLRLWLKRGTTTTKTPIVVSYVLRGLVAWDRRREFILPILVDANRLSLTGAEDELTPPIVEGRLRSLALEPWVKLRLWEANTSGVEAEAVYNIAIVDMVEEVLSIEKDRWPTKLFTLRAVEVKLA